MDFSPTTSQMFPIVEHLLVAAALSGTLTLMKLLIFLSHLQPHSSRTGQELTAWLRSFNSEIKPFVQGACRWINWRSRSPNSLCCLRGAALGHFQKQRRSCFLWSADSASKTKKIPCFWKFMLYGPLVPNQLLKDHETDLALLGLPTLPHHSRREG